MHVCISRMEKRVGSWARKRMLLCDCSRYQVKCNFLSYSQRDDVPLPRINHGARRQFTYSWQRRRRLFTQFNLLRSRKRTAKFQYQLATNYYSLSLPSQLSNFIVGEKSIGNATTTTPRLTLQTTFICPWKNRLYFLQQKSHWFF